MRFVLFYHSLVSDWNHPGAHFLRGIATELLAQGHAVQVFEPWDGWSLHNLREQGGEGIVKAFHAIFPQLRSTFYDPRLLDLDEALADADVVIAHEWNDPQFLRRLGEHRASRDSYKLLFHDAPHRSAAQRLQVRECGFLSHFDGVLAASDGLRRMYPMHSWSARVWTWREAVDTRVFKPLSGGPTRPLDLVWIGGWGEGERVSELNEFLLDPVRALGLRARFYGEPYPKDALHALRAARIDYAGWIPDFSLPAAYAAGRFTVHVPRRLPASLPHTPVIRILEALACGIALVSAPWEQCGELFTPGVDLLIAHDGPQMQRHLLALRNDPEFARFIAANGHQTVIGRHTCAHRVQELLEICRQLGASRSHAAEGPARNLTMVRKGAGIGRSHAPAAWN